MATTKTSPIQLGLFRRSTRGADIAHVALKTEEVAANVRLIEKTTELQTEKSESEIGMLRRENDAFRDSMEKRFEAVGKRFEAVDKRFEAIDKRFEAIDKRFEAIDKRFDRLEDKIDNNMKWIIGIIITLVIGFVSLWLK